MQTFGSIVTAFVLLLARHIRGGRSYKVSPPAT
jgi:hypothetical protein